MEDSRFKKGSILLIAVLFLGILMTLGSYFLSFTLAESKMSTAQTASVQAYYLAEAGLSEAIWKLKNDSVWKASFETKPTVEDPDCSSWSIPPLLRAGEPFMNGSYTVLIENLGCAKARLTSLAKFQISDGVFSQRIIETRVFKAIGEPLADYAILTSGSSENIHIKFTDALNIHNGSIFSNNNINIKYWSTVNVDEKVLAHNNIDVSSGFFASELNAVAQCSKNRCEGECPEGCPPAEISSMPSLSFDSYLQAAQDNQNCALFRSDGETDCYFDSSGDFEKMLWENYPAISLTGVVYVDGDVNIRAGQELTVNGTLVSGENKDINIGEERFWYRAEWPFIRSGSCKIIVTRPGLDSPSGILAQRKMNGGGWLGMGTEALDVHGLIYAGSEMRFSGIGADINVHGGIVVRKFTLSSMWSDINIFLDSDIITDTFQDPVYSPIITIDHWEESY